MCYRGFWVNCAQPETSVDRSLSRPQLRQVCDQFWHGVGQTHGHDCFGQIAIAFGFAFVFAVRLAFTVKHALTVAVAVTVTVTVAVVLGFAVAVACWGLVGDASKWEDMCGHHWKSSSREDAGRCECVSGEGLCTKMMMIAIVKRTDDWRSRSLDG
jgi:hypothetical protein